MAGEPMELAKNISKHTPYPAAVQIKYDGVPLAFTRKKGEVVALTRQNEKAVSVQHICSFFEPILKREGDVIIGECLIPGKPFKESSGAVRKQVWNPKIVCIVFDGCITDREARYIDRRSAIFSEIHRRAREEGSPSPVHMAPNIGTANNADDFEAIFERVKSLLAYAPEGLMGHDINKPFNPGKRCHGMARYKPQPTIDLLVDGFEEAVSEQGEPLGMLGRVNAKLGRADGSVSVVGIGPGRLSHPLRRAVWQAYVAAGRTVPPEYRMIEVKYMPDPTYGALRQPTVQQFRTDKQEPDVYAA